MKVVIAGTRTIEDYGLVQKAVRDSGFPITEVVSGMARGVDTLALRYAEEHKLPVAKFPADWNRYGRSAGYRRNVQMAEYADGVIAITTGSPGTQHMIDIARDKSLPLYVLTLGGSKDGRSNTP